jgi:hypothetical protein
MVTVQQVFDMAIHLMDEQGESNGATGTVDTQEYKFRTISILNSVIPALYPYSGTFKIGKAARPVPTQLIADDYQNPDFEQTIPLDDALSLSVLPYFLAAQLLAGENETLAAWFMNRYRELFMDLRDMVPASFEPITTSYGGF